jgi:hypothetical protein
MAAHGGTINPLMTGGRDRVARVPEMKEAKAHSPSGDALHGTVTPEMPGGGNVVDAIPLIHLESVNKGVRLGEFRSLAGQIQSVDKRNKVRTFHGVHPDYHGKIKQIIKNGLKKPSERLGGCSGAWRIPVGHTCFCVDNWADAIFFSSSARYSAAYGTKNLPDGTRKVMLLVCYIPADRRYQFKGSTLAKRYDVLDWETVDVPLEIRVDDSNLVQIEGIIELTIPPGVQIGNFYKSLSVGDGLVYENLTVATLPKKRVLARFEEMHKSIIRYIKEMDLVDNVVGVVAFAATGAASCAIAVAVTTGPVGWLFAGLCACAVAVGAAVGIGAQVACHNARKKTEVVPKDTLGDSSKVLGIDKNDTREIATAAFRKLALRHHPDRGGSNDKMAEVLAAWATYQIKRGWISKDEVFDENKGPATWAKWFKGIWFFE